MEKKPIYVKVDEYKEVLEIIGLIKKKVDQSKKVLAKIYELKNQEDSELDSWKADLEEIDKKMASISGTLSEPEG